MLTQASVGSRLRATDVSGIVDGAVCHAVLALLQGLVAVQMVYLAAPGCVIARNG